MSKERENKNIAARWLECFWGASWSPTIVDDLAADDIILQFSLQSPRCGRDEAKKFLAEIHEAFCGLEFHSVADLAVDGDYVFGRLEGSGTHTGATFLDFLVGFLPAKSGQNVHLAGTTTLRVQNGRVAEAMTRVTWAVERPRVGKAAA
jgi:hypothetical protein